MADVLTERRGGAGWITLNRPRARNALDLGMIHAITKALDGWREDPAIRRVVMTSSSELAFCSGGDVRAVRRAVLDSRPDGDTFFRDEYALNLAIATYPKPFIALIDGTCMGGGLGVSIHGTHRVVTERAAFAMPETAIGFFPDIGASYFLPRLPGAVGMYLGLTGSRMLAGDALATGLATGFVGSSDAPAELERLASDDLAEPLGWASAPHSPLSSPLNDQRDRIARCFGQPTLTTVLEALAAEDHPWPREVLALLQTRCPTSLAVTFELLRQGASMSVAECLAMELHLTRVMATRNDFVEGVRAVLVDKDGLARWEPATLAEVDFAWTRRQVALAREAGVTRPLTSSW